MAEQLTRNIPGFAGALADTLRDHFGLTVEQHIGTLQSGGSTTGVYIERLDLAGLGDELSFDRGLRDPLKALYQLGYQEPMILIVDALDEALTYTGSINIRHYQGS